MRTRGYSVKRWWTNDGSYAVWRELRWGVSVLVWRGWSWATAKNIANTLNDALYEEEARRER